MPKLSLEEMETHFNIVAADRGTVHIYSDDPVLQRRIEAVGATLVREEPDRCGKHYTLPANQLSLRMPPKPATEEQRERGRALRRAQLAAGAGT